MENYLTCLKRKRRACHHKTLIYDLKIINFRCYIPTIEAILNLPVVQNVFNGTHYDIV